MTEDQNIIITQEVYPVAQLDPTLTNFNLELIEDTDAYGIKPIIVATKKTYTEANRRAQQKYREKYPEKYHESQKKIYNKLKKDEEWIKRYRENANRTAKERRLRKKLQDLENGVEPKKRGRSPKVKQEEKDLEIPIQNLVNQFKDEVVDILFDKTYNFCNNCGMSSEKKAIEPIISEIKKRGRPKKIAV